MQRPAPDSKLNPAFFDALPEPVILLKTQGQGENFEIGYCNNAAKGLLEIAGESVIGKLLENSNFKDSEYLEILRRQCPLVWKTGNQHEESFQNHTKTKYYKVSINRVPDGVFSLTSDHTPYLKARMEHQEQAVQFNSILDASGDGIMLLEAIRDAENEVTDFRIAYVNKAGRIIARLSPASIGKTLLQVFPHLVASEQFLLHVHVLATGEPARIESTFRTETGEEYGWFIVSLVKHRDNVVSTFVDLTEKRKNEQKIAEQAEMLSSIFEASTNGIFACEAQRNESGVITDFAILKINNAFTRIIGKTAAEAEGALYLSLFPSAKNNGAFQFNCDVIYSGKNQRKEMYYVGEGLDSWFDVSAVKRGYNGIVITFNDITESKKNKQAIEDAAINLQDVIDSTQTGIVLMTPERNAAGKIADFRFKTVNRVLEFYTGKERSELIGKLQSEIFTDGAFDFLLSRFRAIIENKKKEDRFEYYHHFDRRDNWFDLLIKKREGDLLITFLDITPIKKLQVEVLAAAEKLSKVINTTQTGIFTLLPVYDFAGILTDFRFGLVNQELANYVHQTPANLEGELASAYFAEFKKNGLFEIYKTALENDFPQQFDFHYTAINDYYFNIKTVRIGEEILVTFTDHTYLKKLSVQLESSVTELKQKNANLEEFAYAASHDLQEPLRKIHYFSERLRKLIGNKLSENESGMFERMESASRRMSGLIHDLLSYSHISRNSGQFEKVDLTHLVQQVLVDIETSVQEKQAHIAIDKLPVIQGDPVQLRQLFQNILSNSLKYSHADQSLTITISCTTVTKTLAAESKPYYRIEIADNGIGFEQDQAEKIFKVFHRLHGQSQYPGTGIGLAIVLKVVQNHGGFISAESEPGQGARFVILLPANTAG